MFKNLLRLRNLNSLHQQPRQLLGAASQLTRLNSTVGKKCADEAAAEEHKKQLKENLKKHINPFNSTAFPPQDGHLEQDVESASDRERRLKVLQLEADIGCQEGRRIPSLEFFTKEHWDHILTLPTKSARFKYYNYLWQIQVRKESRDVKKKARSEEILQRKAEQRLQNEQNNHIIYGLTHTTMFLRIYDSTINHWLNNKLIRAMQFSPKIVFDCSYDEHMTRREAQNAAKQLMLSFAGNRSHDEPFDLHFCNVDLHSVCMQSLKRYIPTMLNPDFPMNIHSQCFTELFPKQNLVYLTPHCRTDLHTYNPDDVYIVGAMVDTVNNDPISLGKAKRLGLRMARLPLDHHLQWGAGSGKSLTLNHMVQIMLDIKSTGDWAKALKHVPRRKIVPIEGTTHQERQQAFMSKRSHQLSVRIDQIFDRDDRRPRYTATKTPAHFNDQDSGNSRYIGKKVQERVKNLEFDLKTWGSSRRNT